MFDVFPLTQNEASPVVFHGTINLVMIASYFIIFEKQIQYLIEILTQTSFFRLDQLNQDEIGKVI